MCSLDCAKVRATCDEFQMVTPGRKDGPTNQNRDQKNDEDFNRKMQIYHLPHPLMNHRRIRLIANP